MRLRPLLLPLLLAPAGCAMVELKADCGNGVAVQLTSLRALTDTSASGPVCGGTAQITSAPDQATLAQSQALLTQLLAQLVLGAKVASPAVAR